MRCCRRSTTWFASACLALCLGAPLAAQGQATAGTSESEIRQAVAAAVKGKMGHDATVRIEAMWMAGKAAPLPGLLIASPEPGARLGRPVRFSLVRRRADGGAAVPAGVAVATVFVSVEHVRAARSIGRGEACTEADLQTVDGDVGAVLLQRLPRRAEIVGSRALRPVGENEILTRVAVAARPTVQSGDAVVIRARAGAVQVEGQGVATQSGGPGDLIRVVNKDSRRPLRARIVGPGQVEVVQ